MRDTFATLQRLLMGEIEEMTESMAVSCYAWRRCRTCYPVFVSLFWDPASDARFVVCGRCHEVEPAGLDCMSECILATHPASDTAPLLSLPPAFHPLSSLADAALAPAHPFSCASSLPGRAHTTTSPCLSIHPFVFTAQPLF